MRLFLVALGTLCLIGRIHSQGFIPPQIDPTPHNPYRRQLTPAQQSHILSDIQQHQHRFSLHPQQQQPQSRPFQTQQQADHPIGPGPTQQSLPNQRPPPLHQSGNPIRFPQNGFRSNFAQPSQQIVQHHTQTNFIPNFVPQSSSKNNLQYQRSLQNQLHVPQPPFAQEFAPQSFGPRNRGIPPLPQGSVQNPQFVSPQPLPSQSSPYQQLPFVNQQQYQGGPQSIPPFQQNSQGQYDQPEPVPPFQGQFPPQFQNAQQFQPAPTFQSGPQFQTAQQFQTAPQFPPLQQADSEKLKLIQKHEAFVQKQYEKQQNKVRQLHDEFVQKQQGIKEGGNSLKSQPTIQSLAQITRSRGLLPSEVPLFEEALRRYHAEHPTTTTTTTTTTTPRNVARSKSSQVDEQFEQLIKSQREEIRNKLKLEAEEDQQVFTKLRNKEKPKSVKPLAHDELLKQLKLALADSPQDTLGNKTYDSMDLVLPNGQTVQVIRTTDPNLIKGQSAISASELSGALKQESFPNERKKKEDSGKKIPLDVAPLTSKDLVLPNGKKVEIVRAPDPSSIGGLTQLPDDIASLYGQNIAHTARVVSSDGPPSLEELAKQGLIPEGFEIAGIPGSGSAKAPAPTPPPPPPPPKKKATYVYLEEQSDGSFKIQGVKANGEKETKTSGAEVDSILERIKSGEIKLPPTVKKISLSSEEEPKPRILNKPVTRSTTHRPPPSTQRYTEHHTTQAPRRTYHSSSPSTYSTHSSPYTSASTPRFSTASSTYQTTPAPTSYFSSIESSAYDPVTEKLIQQPSTEKSNAQSDLIQILKANGLFAMAKYLKQSGLDNILNETGPYTIFAPTDKAFKNLLIQLGGPERAEEKFKSNPRLLSGLLLHHVIPGSFEISSLQDEMTGVSLAGTQLRVNQYSMHDEEWNDVITTTINGAMVVPDKQDIKIPQGIAQGVDRVMFPLPVGDLLQTLQSDRERRFGTFLKILYASGMSDILLNKGTKTYTVFAPTDKAFSEFDSEELERLVTEKDAAQAFAMKHITPGTLFSAGMRFYQVKDSLLPGKSITLQKTNNGKIKVNESQMITSNIPATNGVIHALDGLL